MKHLKTIIAGLALLVFQTGTFCATSVLYDSNSLSSCLITAIEQDHEGYIWIGTEYGLNRFDGINFKEYLQDGDRLDSIKSNIVRSILCDSQGRLWIGYLNGIQKYDPETDSFLNVSFDNASYTPNIHEIIELRSGRILAYASHLGIFEIDPVTMTARHLQTINELCGSARINTVFSDSNERLWVSTTDNGVFCINSTMDKVLSRHFENIKTNNFGKFGQNRDNVIILAFNNEVYMFDEVHKEFIRLNKPKGDKLDVYDILKRSNGEILISSLNNGVYRIDEDKHSVIPFEINYPEGLNRENVKIVSLMEDRHSNLWCGCFQKGLILIRKTDEANFRHWTIPQADGGFQTKHKGHVSCIYKDSKGDLWCGTEDSELIRMDDHWNIKQRVALEAEPTCIFEDSEGMLWVGITNHGMIRMKPESGKMTPIRQLDGMPVREVKEGANKKMYIALDSEGIWTYDLTSHDCAPLDDSDTSNFRLLRNRYINKLIKDSKDRLWIGHYLGVSCYDTRSERFLDIAKDSVLNTSVCYALIEAKDGNIWIGTNTGLYRYSDNDGTYERFTTSEGLSSNMICGLAEDKDGNIWCSTFRGINCMYKENGKTATWYAGRGSARKEYTRTCYHSDGVTIYFGEQDGITAFNPPINIERLNSHLKITAIHIGKEEIPIARFRDKITLKHDENTFTIDISPMTVTETDFQIHYRLLGLDDDWHVTPYGINHITYNHLKPGRYTLEAYIEDNAFSTETYSWDIHIERAWYAGNYAISIYILLAVTIMALSYNGIRRRQRERNNLLKLQQYANIAHEIRSHMTMIMNPINSLQKIHEDPESIHALETIRRNTERVIRMADQFLGIRNLDQGKIKIDRKDVNLNNLIRKSMNAFTYQAEIKRIRLSFEPETDNICFRVDENHLDTIMNNLLGNAFKYTPEGGEIIIRLQRRKEDDSIVISVSDSGQGIRPKDLKRIFNRFYQSETGVEGFGIGLNLCHMLVSLHGGSITASNRTDRSGAVFTVIIPPPAPSQNDSEEAAETNEKKYAIQKNKPKRHERILILDDDDETRLYLEEKLSSTYRIITADNGNSGIEKALRQLPDLIISDVKMPGLDGYQLVKKLKSNSNTTHIPVILLTAKQDLNDRITGFEQGADGYMSKPFDLKELESLIENMLINRQRMKGKYSGAHQEDKIKEIEVKSDDEILMERIMKVINNNLDNCDLTVELLAKEIGLSRVHLHRKLKNITGITTVEFIRNIRLKKAAELLRDKKLNISQIAYIVGFSSHTHFSTAFKKFYGMSPTEYIDKVTKQD